MADSSVPSVVPEVAIDAQCTRDVAEPLSGKARRRLEDLQAIGGLRDPRSSILKIPGCLRAGRRVRQVLEKVLEEAEEELEQALSSVGSSEATGFSPELVGQA